MVLGDPECVVAEFIGELGLRDDLGIELGSTVRACDG
jgi:hypothetical protein